MLILPVGNIGLRQTYNVLPNVCCPKPKYQYNNVSDVVSFGSATDILRFKQVDGTLYRGGRPSLEQLSDLKDLGISTIVDFSTEPFKVADYNEADYAKALRMNHVKIPFVSFENPSDEDVKKFFNTVEDVKSKNQKMFIHCFEGKDRTGLFVELYKIRYGLSDAQTSINTLIKSRYNFSENPLAINFIKDFAKKFHR